MTLDANTLISHYRILSPIGKGGMGEVYRALDERLDRKVAIKVLPKSFSKDEDRLARFAQETRATSALSHPNIIAVFDIGEHEGSPYMVTELLEGEELRDRLNEGPLPVRKAISLASEIASGLAAAHGKGIVHRDLKPENIFITSDERVKILDFGIAKLAEKEPAHSEDATRKALTDPGMVLGTAAYMSPEQVRGQSVDHRSDIFSFGAILAEMVTGKQVFRRDTMAETMAAILKEEPEETSLSGSQITPAVMGIIRRCLEKRPELRFQSMTDLGFALEDLSTGSQTAEGLPGRAYSNRSGKELSFRAGLSVIALIGGAILGAFLWSTFGAKEDPHEGMMLSVLPPSGSKLSHVGSLGSVLEISPDGTQLLFRANGSLYVRKFDTQRFVEVSGSQGISNQPTWKGPSAVSFPTATREWMNAGLPDGAAEAFAKFNGFTRGGTWSDSGIFLFATSGLLKGVDPDGEPVEIKNTSGRRGDLAYPFFIPGSDEFLALFIPDDGSPCEVWLATLTGNEMTDVVVLLENDTPARFTPYKGGNILFVKNDNLYAQKLVLSSRSLSGEPRLVIRGVATQPSRDVTKAEFSVSQNGVIAWRSGETARSRITIFDRVGKVAGTAGPENIYSGAIVVSPTDDARLLTLTDSERFGFVEVGQVGLNELPGDTRWFMWTSDGKEVIGIRGDNVVARAADSGTERVLGRAPENMHEMRGISPDGRSIVGVCETGGPICVSMLGNNGAFAQAVPIINNDEFQPSGAFSPDGKYLLYSVRGDDASSGVFVQQFPGSGRRYQIAKEGRYPVWRGDGKEILYIYGESVWSVEVSGYPDNLSFGEPKELFSGVLSPSNLVASSRPLQVSADGSRIYWVQATKQTDDGVINVMFGF